MSYDLKYRSNFYNIFGKAVHVKIYKKNYGVHDVIYLRTNEVLLEVNYQDENTPIIGTGVKVNIINTGTFDSLEDLLTSREREFECIIVYDNVIVFDGFSICDLNEQQLLPNSKITLQFTDYIRRLDGAFLSCLSEIGVNTDILTILQEVIQTITLSHNLLVNSTLFETTMNQGVNDTFLEQTFIENNMFYSDSVTYDDAYSALNKILKSFGAFLYSSGDNWILERLDDVTRSGNWVEFANLLNSALPSGGAIASQRKIYNKQDGDFHYVNLSQIVEYNSGLKTLILNLKDNQLDTFVFNDYKASMLTTDVLSTDLIWQTPGTFELRKWYMYVDNYINTIGYSFRGMGSYIKWTGPIDQDYEFMGLNYAFKVTFNQSEDVPTELSINFKQSGELDITPIQTVATRFILTIDEGPMAGYCIAEIPGPTGELIWGLSVTPTAIRNDFDVSATSSSNKVWNVSESINLSDPISVPVPGFPPITTLSIWQMLGNPESLRFIISFLPAVYFMKGTPAPRMVEAINYIGDVAVNITQQQILNKLTYFISADFIKTEELDIDFWDLVNDNFGNGIITKPIGSPTEGVKTALWETYQYVDPSPLMDIFARIKFGNYCKTLHKLKGTIQHDGYLKPFSILTDDNLVVSGVLIKFLLRGYTWDLNNGQYEIEAHEYTEEGDLAESSDIPPYESSGAGTVIDISLEIPTIPTGLSVSCPVSGGHMTASWNAVINATGYRLSRKLYSSGSDWVSEYKDVYNGPLLTFDDEVQLEGTLSDGSQITYKVSAYNANGESLACAEVIGIWYAAI